MRNRDTLEFIGLWEILHNPSFNRVEFDTVKNEAGLNRFTLSPKRWIETTNAVGIISRAGRYGGTYAHKDIAFEFASWISPEFKLYIIKDYQRLREEENYRLSTDLNLRRELTKINYLIHTDAIKDNLIHNELTQLQIEGVINLANYDKVTKEKAEIFLKLYKKYLLLKLDDMKYILQTLPSNVIDRCFHSVKFFDDDFDISKLDESTFGVGGLYGCNKIQNLVRELEFAKEYEDKQKLDEFMERYGFKINRKNIGVKGLE